MELELCFVKLPQLLDHLFLLLKIAVKFVEANIRVSNISTAFLFLPSINPLMGYMIYTDSSFRVVKT